MRTFMLTASAVALSCSFAFAQMPPQPPEGAPAGEEPGTPPPPGEEQPGEDMPQSELDAGGVDHHAPGGTGREARGDGPRHEMHRGAPRHHMGHGGPRGGPGWRAMRAGPEFKVEIDEDGGVKVEVKCGAREEARGCADIAMELLDRALDN